MASEFRKIRTHMGFELDSSNSTTIVVMQSNGYPAKKPLGDIAPGDRIAIRRSTSRWAETDPTDGLAEHMDKWIQQFQGKRGPKPKTLIL